MCYLIKMFYKAREKVITLFDDYTTLAFKAKNEAKYLHLSKCFKDCQWHLHKSGNTSEN